MMILCGYFIRIIQRKRGIKMIGFILGSFLGGTVGVFAMAMCVAAKDNN